MITFYKADETDFDNNGLGVLDHDIQNPDIEEKLNDIFTFSFNYPIFAVNGSRLAARMIVKADDPENSGQLFRILKLSKSNGMLTAFCYHIFYDLNGNEIPDTNIVGQNGQTAITQMLSKTAVAHKFQGYSDIAETANIRVVRMSPVKFLIDPQTDNNFINRLGGEIRRVNYRIWMNKVRGSDNGATIRWKKSLDSYNATWDYTTITTRIRPVGYNGIMLPESYVDSPLIDKYETIVIKEIQYSDIKAIDPNATSNDETAVPLEQAYELLRQAAAKEFSGNNLDKPTVTLSVNMVALRNMDEYKDVKSLETINPWDTVTVINERDGLSVKVRLNHYHWNPVTRKFISMELGNSKSSFTDIVSKVDHANDVANQANDTANTAAESANGKNSNYYGPSEPSRPVDGDLWYKKNGDKTELWQYDGKSVPPGWKLVVDDATGEEVRQNVDAAQKEAEEAKEQANKAVDGANDAVAKAGFANDTAEEAKSDAAAAGQQAKDALTNAGTALTNAKNALTNSSSAMADSAQARKDSATAKIQATNAATQANQAVTDASTAKADAAAAKGQATNALGQAGTAIGNAADALNKINDMSVGGRNYIISSKLNSYAPYNTKPVATNGGKTITTTYVSTTVAYLTIAIANFVPENKQYTLSGKMTINGVPVTTDSFADAKASTYNWRYKSKIKISDDGTFYFTETYSGTSEWIMHTNIKGIKVGDVVVIENLKFEKGNQATDWTPAPEDVQIQIDNVNGELSQKVSQTTYNTLAGTVDTVSTLAKQNQSTISTLATKNSVDTASKTATTAQTLAQQNANELLNKASTNTVDTLTQRVTTAESTLSQTATKAELQVAQTNVDNLKKTVTSNTAGMTANANAIKLKADSSTVSDLDGRVTSLSGQLDVQSDLISAKVTASDVTGMLGNYATQTWTQSQIKSTADSINLSVSKVQTDLSGTKTQFAALGVKVDGIQTTVSDKADKSQVTQLAGQITSVVGSTSNPNLVPYSGHPKDNAGWSLNSTAGKPQVVTHGFYENSGATLFKLTNNSATEETIAGSNRFPVKEDKKYTISGLFFADVNVVSSDIWFLSRPSGNTSNFTVPTLVAGAQRFSPSKAEYKSYTFTMPHGVNEGYIRIDNNGSTNAPMESGVFFGELKMELGDHATPWVYDDSQSQITQLSNDINLRVQKGDVVNQINISPESILIAGQKVHITGQTSIDNAVIKDAMIADIKADKITTGTLNAANVNVINLNANNITTGTIKGANLSMNLNTGEVVFQHGRIHSASNNIDINVDEGYLSTASNNTRVMLKDGQLQLVEPTIFDKSKDPYLQISNSVGGASFNGANIIARDYLVLANRANSDAFFDAPLDEPETFAGLAVGKTSAGRWKPTRIGGADRGIIMRGGTAYMIDSSFMYKESPEILIGTDGAGSKPSDRIYINGSYVHIPSAYWRTDSGSANVVVARDGALVRSTSASKYKTDIVRTNKSDYGDKLLNLPTATWTDIAETKRYRDNPTTQPKPTRNFGMIAEDLADAGLEMLVVRGTDGELEGINYDRIGPALIPVIAKLKNEVEILKRKLEAETAWQKH